MSWICLHPRRTRFVEIPAPVRKISLEPTIQLRTWYILLIHTYHSSTWNHSLVFKFEGHFIWYQLRLLKTLWTEVVSSTCVKTIYLLSIKCACIRACEHKLWCILEYTKISIRHFPRERGKCIYIWRELRCLCAPTRGPQRRGFGFCFPCRIADSPFLWSLCSNIRGPIGARIYYNTYTYKFHVFTRIL